MQRANTSDSISKDVLLHRGSSMGVGRLSVDGGLVGRPRSDLDHC
jgi:hypothetical protein